MPLLENESAIKEYYEQEKHKYPDLTFEQFRECSRSPAQFFKECIKSGRLQRILVKHLGKFRVFPSRLKDEIAKIKRLFQYNIITEDVYKQDLEWAEYHLKRIQDEKADKVDKDDEGQTTH